MTPTSKLSAAGLHCALRLRLKGIRRKIAKEEEEIRMNLPE